jgi:hypothetical protein
LNALFSGVVRKGSLRTVATNTRSEWQDLTAHVLRVGHRRVLIWASQLRARLAPSAAAVQREESVASARLLTAESHESWGLSAAVGVGQKPTSKSLRRFSGLATGPLLPLFHVCQTTPVRRSNGTSIEEITTSVPRACLTENRLKIAQEETLCFGHERQESFGDKLFCCCLAKNMATRRVSNMCAT